VPPHWFTNPWAFWLLTGLPFLAGLALLGAYRRRRARLKLGTRSAVESLVTRRNSLGALRGLLTFAGLSLLCVGIAGPQWGRDWEQAVASGRDLVVLLDLSRSMLAQDVLPSRLERAKEALAELSYAFQRRGGHRLALVIFAARARVICPLTQDYDHFRLALAQQTVPGLPAELRPSPGGPTSGTRLGAGLRTAVQTADSGGPGPKMILLLSDGDDPARDGEWRKGVAVAQKVQVPVVAVGIGDPEPRRPVHIPLGDDVLRHDGAPVQTRLEEKPLEETARLTNGTYVRAGTSALDLSRLFQNWMQKRTLRTVDERALPVYRQRYPWFFGAALVLLAAAMLIGHPRVGRDAPPPGLPQPALLEEVRQKTEAAPSPSAGEEVSVA
jgi:Ca-activated chloride channel family protein